MTPTAAAAAKHRPPAMKIRRLTDLGGCVGIFEIIPEFLNLKTHPLQT